MRPAPRRAAKTCPICGPRYENLTDGKTVLHEARGLPVCTPALRALVRAAVEWHDNVAPFYGWERDLEHAVAASGRGRPVPDEKSTACPECGYPSGFGPHSCKACDGPVPDEKPAMPEAEETCACPCTDARPIDDPCVDCGHPTLPLEMCPKCHGTERIAMPCPDGRAHCAVAHYRKCRHDSPAPPSETCGARTRYFNSVVSCELPMDHSGSHRREGGGYRWEIEDPAPATPETKETCGHAEHSHPCDCERRPATPSEMCRCGHTKGGHVVDGYCLACKGDGCPGFIPPPAPERRMEDQEFERIGDAFTSSSNIKRLYAETRRARSREKRLEGALGRIAKLMHDEMCGEPGHGRSVICHVEIARAALAEGDDRG
jgi:hypothetical protein